MGQNITIILSDIVIDVRMRKRTLIFSIDTPSAISAHSPSQFTWKPWPGMIPFTGATHSLGTMSDRPYSVVSCRATLCVCVSL